jgi:hypothetical protein
VAVHDRVLLGTSGKKRSWKIGADIAQTHLELDTKVEASNDAIAGGANAKVTATGTEGVSWKPSGVIGDDRNVLKGLAIGLGLDQFEALILC